MLVATNPFSPGSGRPPPALVGRTGELEAFDALRARVAGGRSDRGIILTGLRGVGKTVLLNKMHRMAEQFNWLTVRIEARREDRDAVSLQRTLARELVTASRALSLRLRSDRMQYAFGTISSFNARAQGTRVSLNTPINTGRADSGDLEIDLSELVDDVAGALREHGRAFAIFIDEMQDLDPAVTTALLAVQHAAGQRELPFFIVGAGLPNLARVLTDSRSYAERLFNYRSIGKLDVADSTAALVGPAERLGARFDADALETLLAATDGYPYFIQEFGQAVWNISDKTIHQSDAMAAVQLGTEQLDGGFYRSRWEKATPAERRLLRAMAEDGERGSSTTLLARRMGLQSSSIGPYRASLIAKGLVFSPEHGQLTFTVPGMSGYIERHHPDHTFS